MLDWHRKVKKLYDSGLGDTAISRAVRDMFPDKTERQVYETVRSHRRRVIEGGSVVRPEEDWRDRYLRKLKGGCDVSELDKDFMTAVEHIEQLESEGFVVDRFGDTYKLAKMLVAGDDVFGSDWDGSREIKFGIVSDTHIGSVYTQLTALHKAYDCFEREGISDVYSPGDLTEGEKMRPGHEYECYVHGADRYEDHVVDVYPKREGITTHMISGNHDASFTKQIGLDIVRKVANRRDDINYLGYGRAVLDLAPGCRIEMRHPGGGGSYAISYKPQKIVSSMQGGSKPNILLLGHYHKQGNFFYRNVHTLLAATMQSQSNFMRDMSLDSHVGFYIVTVKVDAEGSVVSILPDYRPVYKMVEDDWKNWR